MHPARISLRKCSKPEINNCRLPLAIESAARTRRWYGDARSWVNKDARFWLTAIVYPSCSAGENEPAPRSGHRTVLVGSNVYMWAGLVNGLPIAHDLPEKRQFLSSVEVFHIESGDWLRLPTSGTPPLGVCGYGCAAVGDSIYYFGGECGHGHSCFHNSLHKLSTSSMHWESISPTTIQDGIPMPKSGCGMVAFKSERVSRPQDWYI